MPTCPGQGGAAAAGGGGSAKRRDKHEGEARGGWHQGKDRSSWQGWQQEGKAESFRFHQLVQAEPQQACMAEPTPVSPSRKCCKGCGPRQPVWAPLQSGQRGRATSPPRQVLLPSSLAPAPSGEAGRAEGSTRASSSPQPEATGSSSAQNRDTSSGSQSQAELAPPGPGLSATLWGVAGLGLEPGGSQCGLGLIEGQSRATPQAGGQEGRHT